MTTPERLTVADVPGDLGRRLDEAGYRACWHVGVVPGHTTASWRLVAATPSTQQVSAATAERMARARELLVLAMQRATSDQLLAHAATHDALTQLLDRHGFYERVAATDGRTGPVGLLYLDLDDFKPVNDRYGHAAGDEVLRVVARRLRHQVRGDDVAARLGGDEFAVLLADAGDQHQIEDVARRVRDAVAEPIELEVAGRPTTVSVSVSVGAAVAVPPLDVDRLLTAADEAMYEAKRSGRPCGGIRRLDA